MEKIFLFGAGHHCNVVIDIIEKKGKYKIAGIIDSKREIGSNFNDYKIIGRQEKIAELSKKYKVSAGIITVGDNYSRSQLVSIVSKQTKKFKFINAIHPSVIIGKCVKIGVGNVIMAGVVINPGAVINNHCILNSCSFLEHDCIQENYSSIAPGVSMGGLVTIREYSAIAVGVSIRDRIIIGKHTVVGSGAVVTKDIPANCIAYGNPARVTRSREIGEKYLK